MNGFKEAGSELASSRKDLRRASRGSPSGTPHSPGAGFPPDALALKSWCN